MFQEEIAALTATHLRGHLNTYLDYVESLYSDGIKLQYPKSIETENLVGGVYNTKVTDMPAYAIDIISKGFSEFTENLYLYNYEGHIAGVMTAQDEQAANRICKRHEQATEMFVKDHEFLHELTSTKTPPNDFKMQGMGFVGAAFSGAEMVAEQENRQTWIAGFRIDLLWVVSEGGPHQHE
jgi:hypothetical protein